MSYRILSVILLLVSAMFISSTLAESPYDGYCGDGFVNPGQGEECDDGNNVNDDGCDEDCLVEDEICYVPLDIMLVMDRSGSMQNFNRLNDAKAGAKAFVDLLNSSLDHAGLVSFGTDATLDHGLTTDFGSLKSEIDMVVAGGDTNLGESILIAQAEIEANAREGVQNVMVILSDGAPTRYPGGRCELPPFEECVDYALDQADAAKDAGTVIYTIGYQIEAGSLPEDVLIDVATDPSRYYAAASLEDLEEINKRITETACPCGNGIVEPELGEECDDGNNNNYDGCTNQCRLAECGDGYARYFGGDEECELPSTFDNLYCPQSESECLGNKYAERDSEGDCDSSCVCVYDPLEYQCVVGMCGAECSQDQDCDDMDNKTIDSCHMDSCLCEFNPFCGNGVIDDYNGYVEECDGTDGVGPHQVCSGTCTLIDLTYCGDGIKQSPNEEGLGGPLNDGYEACDGSDGVGAHQVCSASCTLVDLTYCGDGVMQTPNDEGTGGPLDDGYEECDGTDGVPVYYRCASDCTLVCDKPPETVKTVGMPREEWDGSDAHFYDIADLCWNGDADSIDCWTVTMTTPLTLGCSGVGFNGDDGANVCFAVELDGDDMTEAYCGYYGGTYDQFDDGFCCLDHEIENFLFREESEHNLQYYCMDKCGKSEIDDEKFKVTGTDFHIQLHKKWNLISVPFMLIDDSPDAVFGQLEHVEAVWAYDSVEGEWMVWSEEGPDTLEHILPGWGYWVMQMEDEVLTIGGSLIQPGSVPPSRTLAPGWNLIGYYGTDWEEYPDMVDMRMVCGNSDGSYGEKVYCALSSLIDTQQGYPRWSSLWSYVNCGNDNTGWVGLVACDGGYDTMYAGRGYWVELDIEDIYAPATNCIWNDDFICLG